MTSKVSVLQLVVLFSIWSTTAFSQDTVILMCDWSHAKISRISLKDKTTKTLDISKIRRPMAIDYDEAKSTIYWTDVDLRQIRATKATDVGDRVVLSLAKDSVPDGIAVDTGSEKVFYTDGGRRVIGVVNMDGRNRDKLITSGLGNPMAIVLYQEKRKLYFTDIGGNPFIAVANYGGRNVKKIFTSRLVSPTGLALDKTSNMLFWCGGGKIETGSINGDRRKILLSDQSSHFFDIFLFGSVLYFTDWNQQSVSLIPKSGGTIHRLPSGHITKLTGIYVYSTPPKCGSWLPCPGCGQCETGTACEEHLGICFDGCNPGYKGDSCKRKCPSGYFGEKCASLCGPCENGTCDHVTGRCPDIPGTHILGKECPSGSYGKNCAKICGACRYGPCDKVTGYCPHRPWYYFGSGALSVFQQRLSSLLTLIFFSSVLVA